MKFRFTYTHLNLANSWQLGETLFCLVEAVERDMVIVYAWSIAIRTVLVVEALTV